MKRQAMKRPRFGLVAVTGVAGAIVALALAALFVLLLLAIVGFRHASLTARHAQEAIASANRLETVALDLETGLRGFVITRDERSLQPWKKAQKAYPGQMSELLRLSADSPPQEARARAIQRSINVYLRDFSLPLVEFMRRNPA